MSSVAHWTRGRNTPCRSLARSSGGLLDGPPSGVGSPLGIHAKSSSTAPQSGPSFEVSVTRRFALQAAARSLLPRERVACCMRYRFPSDAPGVSVYYQPEHGSASFGGLQTCGSVWHCPVCSARISERRREELARGVEAWLAAPGVRRVLLITFTLRHDLGDAAISVLRLLKKAYKSFRNGRWWANWIESSGYQGSVRSLETTHGDFGWHPHLHCLFFFDQEVNIAELEHAFKVRWMQQVQRLGGYASYEYGVDVRFSDKDIAEYVAKFGKEPTWTAADELTKSNAKKGRRGGRSPLQLLSDYADGDHEAGALWQVYAMAFRGERQLYWSNGFRKELEALGLEEEKSDEQLAQEHDADGVLAVELDDDAWRAVVGNDARAEVLAVVATGDFDKMRAFFQSLGIGRGVRFHDTGPLAAPPPELVQSQLLL